MERKQFTFYSSFYDGISRIKNKAARCDAYEAVIRYALFGEEPALDKVPDAAAMAFMITKPILDSARKKAESGSKGGASKPEANASNAEANAKQTASKPQARGNAKQEKEQEIEQEKEQDIGQMSKETTQRKSDAAFEQFWQSYPRKVGKLDARKSWDRVKGVALEEILHAVERQKHSEQWNREGGRFIPLPATWLNQGRWEDELPAGEGPGYQRHGDEMRPEMQEWLKRSMEGMEGEA